MGGNLSNMAKDLRDFVQDPKNLKKKERIDLRDYLNESNSTIFH